MGFKLWKTKKPDETGQSSDALLEEMFQEAFRDWNAHAHEEAAPMFGRTKQAGGTFNFEVKELSCALATKSDRTEDAFTSIQVLPAQA